MSAVKQVTWDDVKKAYLPHENFGHFTVDDALFDDVCQHNAIYEVDDSILDSPRLIKGKYKRIVFDCAETLVEVGGSGKTRKYKTMSTIEEKNIDFVLKFEYDDGTPCASTGKLVVSCSSGQLQYKEKQLSGETQVSLQWKMPKEDTSEAKIKAMIYPGVKQEFDLCRVSINMDV